MACTGAKRRVPPAPRCATPAAATRATPATSACWPARREIYDWLLGYLTAARVAAVLRRQGQGPGEAATSWTTCEGLNFLLERALGGGGTSSLLVDPQGKTLSQALLQMEVNVPAVLLRGLG